MKRFLILLVILILLGGGAMLAGWRYTLHYMQSPLPLSSDQDALRESVIIERGESFNQVLTRLARRGVITQPLLFKVYAKRYQLSHQIKAGEYSLAQATPAELLQRMVAGKSIQHSITLVEGTTVRQMLAQLRDYADILELTLVDAGDQALLAALELPFDHPEGVFLAETYQVTRGSSDRQLLQRSYAAGQQLLQQLWAQRDPALPYKTPYDALIMASIIEKETAVAYERNRIAGVFIRRLQKGMRLQTDPTVIYGMGDAYQGNIRRKDLTRPTPYNTYVINGLPPTPIALVGPDALQAAFSPEPGEWLYFVAKGDGTHQFSRTLAEHNRAVRSYQLNRRSNYRSTPES